MVAILSHQRDAILDAVRMMYTEVALRPTVGYHFPTGRAACEFVGYPAEVLDPLPAAAIESFAGVGYPFAVGVVRAGDVVLDLGSGSGTDSLIAAAMVGGEGRVHALDMTRAMLEKLTATARSAGITNLEVLPGNAEEIPLPDGSVSVVTSNGVLNLVPDKPRCIAEIHRVLAPGGYAQISDIVLGQSLADECMLDPALWAECVVGATLESELMEMFRAQGFDCGVLGSMDYFSGSDSEETRSLAKALNARSIVFWARKPPADSRVRQSEAWPSRKVGGDTPTADAALPEPAAVLDAHGMTCGALEPILKRQLTPLESGEILEVRSDEPAARTGIPSWSRLTGHALVATAETEDGTATRYFLRRK